MTTETTVIEDTILGDYSKFQPNFGAFSVDFSYFQPISADFSRIFEHFQPILANIRNVKMWRRFCSFEQIEPDLDTDIEKWATAYNWAHFSAGVTLFLPYFGETHISWNSAFWFLFLGNRKGNVCWKSRKISNSLFFSQFLEMYGFFWKSRVKSE